MRQPAPWRTSSSAEEPLRVSATPPPAPAPRPTSPAATRPARLRRPRRLWPLLVLSRVIAILLVARHCGAVVVDVDRPAGPGDEDSGVRDLDLEQAVRA